MAQRRLRDREPVVAVLAWVLALLAAGCVAGATFTPPPAAAPSSVAVASGVPADGPPSPFTPTPTTSTPTTSTPTPPEPTPVPQPSCWCPCASASAAYPGVAIARVTLEGGPFFTRATNDPDIRRGRGLVTPAETVVDGVFLDRFQQWDEGAVWWETPPGAPVDSQWIRVALDGPWTLDGAIVQADNNDAYRLAYRDMVTGDWATLITVPPEYSFGMVTRPDQYDDTARLDFYRTVTTDALRFEASEGDGMYSVSEIQVFGTRAEASTPSPAP
jgi:hypothetical protein